MISLNLLCYTIIMSEGDIKNERENNKNIFLLFLSDFFHIDRTINYILIYYIIL